MILIATLFSSLAVMSLVMFKKVSTQIMHNMKYRLLKFFVLITCVWFFVPDQVHAMYRTTGASFEKAQQEFATGVMSNKNVQTAAAKAASQAASQAAEETFREQLWSTEPKYVQHSGFWRKL